MTARSHLVWLEEELVLGAGEAGGGALRPHQLGPEQVGAALQLLAHLAAEARHLRGKTGYRKLQSCNIENSSIAVLKFEN
jgi:hypothetical protein